MIIIQCIIRRFFILGKEEKEEEGGARPRIYIAPGVKFLLLLSNLSFRNKNFLNLRVLACFASQMSHYTVFTCTSEVKIIIIYFLVCWYFSTFGIMFNKSLSAMMFLLTLFLYFDRFTWSIWMVILKRRGNINCPSNFMLIFESS